MTPHEVLRCEDDIRDIGLCISRLRELDPLNIAPDKERGLKRLKIVRDHLRTCLQHAQGKIRREFLNVR